MVTRVFNIIERTTCDDDAGDRAYGADYVYLHDVHTWLQVACTLWGAWLNVCSDRAAGHLMAIRPRVHSTVANIRSAVSHCYAQGSGLARQQYSDGLQGYQCTGHVCINVEGERAKLRANSLCRFSNKGQTRVDYHLPS